ncbi:MAG: hypothetical protein JW751_03585 [Polyangiaceae bacterium]|nr:hypothetical protein [Polyangiaceae bacterium]
MHLVLCLRRPLRRLSYLAAAAALVLGAVTACSSSDPESDGASEPSTGGSNPGTGGSNPGTGGAEAGDTGGTPTRGPTGLFAVSLVAEAVVSGEVTPAHTLVRGNVADGPPVPDRIWEQTAAAGDCQLLEPYAPFCEQDCGTGVCVADGECRARPSNLDLGTVTLAGAVTADGSMSFALMPVAGIYQVPGAITVAYPPAAEGAPLTLTSDGVAVNPNLSPFPAFSVEATGVAPLAITSGETVPMARDLDVIVTWAPPQDATLTEVYIEVDISHHGGQKGQIECLGADTGSLTIPAEIVTALINLGVAGYPNIVVSRRARGTAEVGGGTVELFVTSDATLEVEIPGVVSCTPTEDDPNGGCPEGQSCGELMLCE